MVNNYKEEPVINQPGDRCPTQVRRGSLAGQDSGNFSNSASQTPSRFNHHASSQFQHRKSSQSPPRSRHHSFQQKSFQHGRSPERSGVRKVVDESESQAPSICRKIKPHHTKDNDAVCSLEIKHVAQDELHTGHGREHDRNRYAFAAHNNSSSGVHSMEAYRGARTSSVPGNPSIEPYRGAHTSRIPPPHMKHDTKNVETVELKARPPYVKHDTKNVETVELKARPPYVKHDTTNVKTVELKARPPYVKHDTTNVETVELKARPPYVKHYYTNVKTVELRVPLCCKPCEETVSKRIQALEGVDSVTCDQEMQKVTVRGTASPADILRQCRECFKQAKFW